MTREQRIRKAVFPVAGLGTRFLPATKAVPKEMLNIVDRPILQHVVDEAREAGIEHFIFVTGRQKAVIEDYFDVNFELEAALKARGKTEALATLRAVLPNAGTTSFTRQQEPRGLGNAVWCARDIVGDEPFALLLPDVIVQAPGPSCLAQMVAAYTQTGGNVIAVEEVDDDQTQNYGIVDLDGDTGAGNRWPVRAMVEKPPQGTAPSNFSIMGRYILQPEVFDLLGKQEAGRGGEIQITDAMASMMADQAFHAVRYEGRSFDCGTAEGFLRANVALALKAGIPGIRETLKTLLDEA